MRKRASLVWNDFLIALGIRRKPDPIGEQVVKEILDYFESGRFCADARRFVIENKKQFSRTKRPRSWIRH